MQTKGTKLTDTFMNWIPWFTCKTVWGQTQSQISSYAINVNLRNLLGKNAPIHSFSVLRLPAKEIELGRGKEHKNSVWGRPPPTTGLMKATELFYMILRTKTNKKKGDIQKQAF